MRKIRICYFSTVLFDFFLSSANQKNTEPTHNTWRRVAAHKEQQKLLQKKPKTAVEWSNDPDRFQFSSLDTLHSLIECQAACIH